MNALSKSVLDGLPEGAIEIPHCGIYVKDEGTLEPLFAFLRDRGYGVKETEHGGWYASLREDVCIRKGKCGHCDSYVDVLGIYAHGRDCEVCGKPLCREFVDGGTIDFVFTYDEGFRNRLHMTVKRFDPGAGDSNAGELVLYAEPTEESRIWSLSIDGMRDKLAAFDHEIRRFEEDGVAHIGIPYERGRVGVINTCELSGGFRHAMAVRIYEGKEYSDYGLLPVPDGISIYKAWEGFPLEPSTTLHEAIIGAARMVSRCDYYYQDGRPEFGRIQFERMRLFVEHFTTLDLEAWDRMTERADKSGPGFIRAAAAFCQGVKIPVVTNEPNIGSLLVGFGKVISGEPLTDGDVDAMLLAASDRKIAGEFIEVIKR